MNKFGYTKLVAKFPEKEGDCYIYNNKGKLISHIQVADGLKFWEPEYTPFSLDGKYIFVPSHYRGLFCYEIKDGRLIWKKGPGSIGDIIVLKNCLIINMAKRGIYKRNIKNGNLISKIKMSGIEFMKQIDKDEIFAGPKNNKYFIFSIPNLKIKKIIPKSSININNCLSFVLRQAWKQGNNLFVEGFEEYPNMTYTKEGGSNTFIRSKEF